MLIEAGGKHVVVDHLWGEEEEKWAALVKGVLLANSDMYRNLIKFDLSVPAIIIQIRMGKNSRPEPQAASKTKPIKSIKPKNKEMFTELKTHQENKIDVVGRMKSEYQIKPEMMDEEEG